MNELALFAGAGGGILGAQLLGWRTVCAVEIDEYCRRVLMQRQDDGILEPFPVWDDIRTFDGRPFRGVVDIVTGGFPCQDISCAGKGAGIEGERSGLWSEMARVVGEIRPRYVFVENSPMLVGRGLAVVLGDLAEMGYDAKWGVVGADDAGAPHIRKRVWILGYIPDPGHRGEPERARAAGRQDRQRATERGEPRCDGTSWDVADAMHAGERGEPWEGKAKADAVPHRNIGRQQERCELHGKTEQPGEQTPQRDNAGGFCQDVADAEGSQQERGRDRFGRWQRCEEEPELHPGDGEWWESEPDVGRVVDGCTSRVDKLRALGNAQVPAVVALAWEILTAPD